MSETKKALSRLMFTGKLRTAIIIIMFAGSMFFSLGTFGTVAAVADNGGDVYAAGNGGNVSWASLGISFMSGWMIVCVLLISMESFSAQYNVMRVMPVKKGYDVKYNISRISMIISAMCLFEGALFLILIPELGVIRVLAMLFILAAVLALASVVYSVTLIMRMKGGRGLTLGSLLVLYSVEPLISGLKGKLYIAVASAENGTAALGACILVFVAAIAGAEIAKNKAAELIG